MNWRDFMVLWCFIIAAILVGSIGWFIFSTEFKWAAPAIALGLLSIGLGVNSISMAYSADRKYTAINETLSNIMQIQEDIQKEQKEPTSSSSPLVVSLQALSQYYTDFLAQQKGEQNNEK